MGKYFDEAELLALDAILADVERQSSSNDDLIRRLDKYRISVVGDIVSLSSLDPLSDAYKNAILDVHEEIVGKRYSIYDEGLPVINPDYERDWPYPWSTKSPETVARFLIAYGFLIKTAALPPYARILEVGCGMGSLTWNLARMGYRVDALDPNDVQCACVREATGHFPMPPNVVAMALDEWLSAKSGRCAYKYDAVIFFESFHHLADHQECLRRILDDHLEPGGKLLLAAEPVVDKAGDRLPYPWGPRLDGESIRAMRRWGWLELGFTEEYLRQLFKSLGMGYESAKCNEALPWSRIIIGKTIQTNPIRQDDDGVRYDAHFEDGIQFSKDGMPAFVKTYSGLGERESWGRWTIGDKVIFHFDGNLPGNFCMFLELADVFGPNVHKKLEVTAGSVSAYDTLKEIGVQHVYKFDFRDVNSSVLEILVPHPCRPKDVPELCNEDSRRIGLALVGLKIFSDA